MATLGLQHANELINILSDLTGNEVTLYATGTQVSKDDYKLIKYTTIHFENDDILIRFGIDKETNIRETNCRFVGNDISFDTLSSIDFKMYKDIQKHLQLYLDKSGFDFAESQELAKFGGAFRGNGSAYCEKR